VGKKPTPSEKAEKKTRRIKAGCILLGRQAEARALVVDAPFGASYAIPVAPRGPRGEPVPAHIAMAHVEGWQVLCSVVRYQGGHELRNGSAMLWPKGRSSTEEDWEVLGLIVAVLARDKAAIDMASDQAADDARDPNEPIHWVWRTEAAPATEEAG
jgi:hypothetical protein